MVRHSGESHCEVISEITVSSLLPLHGEFIRMISQIAHSKHSCLNLIIITVNGYTMFCKMKLYMKGASQLNGMHTKLGFTNTSSDMKIIAFIYVTILWIMRWKRSTLRSEFIDKIEEMNRYWCIDESKRYFFIIESKKFHFDYIPKSGSYYDINLDNFKLIFSQTLTQKAVMTFNFSCNEIATD